MDNDNLGKVIKQTRESKNISQEVLSGLAAVDRSHLSKIECGKRSPTVTVLRKLAHAMGVSASDLLSIAENYEDNTHNNEQI